MNIEEQDDVETKEWEEALSLVENIFKDYKNNGSLNAASHHEDGFSLDVARWKVVWGKKPAQYRLKPFLMWSVDEMPSIPEENDSSTETMEKGEGMSDMLKMRKDKQLRFVRRKMLKMRKRLDEINFLLTRNTSADPSLVEKADDISTMENASHLDLQREVLLNERNHIRDKLKKINKKLIAMKSANPEQRRPVRLDLGDVHVVDSASGDSLTDLSFKLPDLSASGEMLSYKHGRRAAIKKETKGTVWSKVVCTSQKENAPRRGESCDMTEDKKYKKKKCCKGNHRKPENLGRGTGSYENDTSLVRQTSSDPDFSKLRDSGSTLRPETVDRHKLASKQKFEGSSEKGICRAAVSGQKSHLSSQSVDELLWQQRPKKKSVDLVGTVNLNKSERESQASQSSQGVVCQQKTSRRCGILDSLIDSEMKKSESGKSSRSKKSSTSKDAKNPKTSQGRPKSDSKDSIGRSRRSGNGDPMKTDLMDGPVRKMSASSDMQSF